MKIYAVYKGEEFLCEGTSKECAEKLNVKIDTIHYWNSKANKKRIASKRINGENRQCKMAFVIEED